jgi:hypothetical protein
MTRDPLYASLAQERFGRSEWWSTVKPELIDSKLMQGIRRRALSEALEDDQDEEVEAV